MRDLPLLFIINLDFTETAFYEEALEKPAVYDSEEEKFITQKAQQDEIFVRSGRQARVISRGPEKAPNN